MRRVYGRSLSRLTCLPLLLALPHLFELHIFELREPVSHPRSEKVGVCVWGRVRERLRVRADLAARCDMHDVAAFRPEFDF